MNDSSKKLEIKSTIPLSLFLKQYPHGLPLEIFFKFSVQILHLYSNLRSINKNSPKSSILTILPCNFFVEITPDSNQSSGTPETLPNQDSFASVVPQLANKKKKYTLKHNVKANNAIHGSKKPDRSYLAPELSSEGESSEITDLHDLERREISADIFSFGVLCFWMLTMKDPFLSDEENLDPERISYLLKAKIPKNVCTSRKDVPRILSELISLHFLLKKNNQFFFWKKMLNFCDQLKIFVLKKNQLKGIQQLTDLNMIF